ncbi:hypothetical protein EYC84_011628 [Monilinia fructicola]|uniref:Uncharacterized protein n=1 Tax=Monilinia fructicola TaxID=38448 RepID=A0A5M9JBU1_MONFR|nr:hypothetical protein EYC84_011628 [Monilinia fructicola]
MARSNGVSDRLRNEESWVEISSQPSSSSISSIDNEIVTTGLRVSQHPSTRRRRRSQNQPRPQVTPNNHRQTSTSSQEEYEESESEPDHIDILTSSNEISPPVAIPARLSTRETYDAESEDDEDENGTALGVGRGTSLPFTPQPNVFSHPPSSQSQNHRATAQTQESYFPHHDAALRASLKTLLSCAAAARGLPKNSPTKSPHQPPHRSPHPPRISTPHRSTPPSHLQTHIPHPPTEHKFATRSRTIPHPQNPAKNKQNTRAALKKKKAELPTENETFISPTLLTWAMSAGVVVLVSVVGFGAGYVIGREVGRQETSVLGGWNASVADMGGVGGRCFYRDIRSVLDLDLRWVSVVLWICSFAFWGRVLGRVGVAHIQIRTCVHIRRHIYYIYTLIPFEPLLNVIV